MKKKRNPWEILKEDFWDLRCNFRDTSTATGKMYFTICDNFWDICREAESTNYENQHSLKMARLMRRVARDEWKRMEKDDK